MSGLPVTTAPSVHRFEKLYGLPEFVKLASQEDLLYASPRDKSPDGFADVTAMKYPCHSAQEAWLSAAHFYEDAPAMHPKQAAVIEQRLLKLADYWRIGTDVRGIKEKRASLIEKQASETSSDDAYAYVWKSNDGKYVERQLPIKSAAQVEAAAAWLLEHRDSFSFTDRNMVAGRILKKAASLEVTLPTAARDSLRKIAGDGYCDKSALLDAIQFRINAIVRPDSVKQLGLLKESVAKLPDAPTQPVLMKVATVLDLVDREAGIKYSDALWRPEELVFGYNAAAAAEKQSTMCRLSNGMTYSKDKMASLSQDSLRDLFGDEFVEAVSRGFALDTEKFASAAAGLSMHEANILDELLKDAGIKPVGNHIYGGTQQITPEQWKSLGGYHPKSNPTYGIRQ